MNILIVAATEMEIAPLTSSLERRDGENAYRCADHAIDVLVTGVGMVATAARTARALALSTYDLALNLGLCGSFESEFAPGTVVHVTSDHLVELGAEDGDNFLTVRDLGLLRDDDPPFEEGRIVNSAPPVNARLQELPTVEGITVNTVHGNARSIEAVVRRFQPQVESMEGAAFMFACVTADVPCAQIRAVSNFVEPRSRADWKIPEAIAALDRSARAILGCL
jgi:futalosine hydrolase